MMYGVHGLIWIDGNENQKAPQSQVSNCSFHKDIGDEKLEVYYPFYEEFKDLSVFATYYSFFLKNLLQICFYKQRVKWKARRES